MYNFIFMCLPNPQKAEYANLKYCKAHIWVMAEGMMIAEQTAKSYVISYGWQPVQIESALDCSSTDPLRLHESEALLYQKAQRFGIAADFLASPKHPKDSVELYHLGLTKN